MSSKRETILVAAVELGTTYCIYAFSFKHEYNKDPLRPRVNFQIWNSRSLLSTKVPTCVLCYPNGEFHSFGYEAEESYEDLAANNAHHGWYIFRRFKMVPYEKQIKRGIEVEDDNGLNMRAEKVFGMAIRYLRCHFLDELEKMGEIKTLVNDEDIHWILTVPAIWADSAKDVMREAATMAGIDVRNLTIAVESYAAVMYCHLSSKEISDDKKYIVINLGDETVDIAVHEKQEDGTINEVYKANSGACGVAQVDEEFNQMIIKIIGARVFKKFCEEYMDDYKCLCREFEIRKRLLHMDTKDTVSMKVPCALTKAYEKESGKTIRDAIEQTPYKGKIKLLGDKMRLDAELFRSLFQNCISKITGDLLDLLEKPVARGISTLLTVGGFSECPLIQVALMDAFPNLKVVKPDDAELAVLKGAAILGHRLGISCDYNFQWQTPTNEDHSPMTTMFAKEDEGHVSSSDIVNLSTCSSSYGHGIRHQTGNLKYESLSEKGEEYLSSDYVEMSVERQKKDSKALETQLINQMTLKTDIERAPSDDELFTLSRKLDKVNKGWWLLAKLLGLSDEKIDEIEHVGGESVRQFYKMLTAWKKQNAGQEKGSVRYLLRQCDEAGVDQDVIVSVFRN